MKRLLTFFIFFFLTSCNINNNNKKLISSKDTISTISSIDSKQEKENVSFKNVSEVISYQKPGLWTDIRNDSSISCTLFFNIDSSSSNTLSVEYSPECWFYFPYKDSLNRIIVYWDKNIDTKYNFEIVKKANQINRKYLHKPFMILELLNDTTLQATYPFPELIKTLNATEKDRVLFPDTYTFSDSDSLM